MTLFRPERRVIAVRSGWAGSPTYNPFENPAVPLSSVALDSAFGLLTQTEAGESVTVEDSPGLPIVWRCVNLLSTVVASCPLKVYRDSDKQEMRVPVLSPYHSWIGPNGETKYPLYTQFELWELVVAHIALWGNAYVYKVRDGGDSIVDLRPINPSRVKVKLDEQSKEKIFEVKRVDKNGNVMPLNPEIMTTFEIMHIPGFGYDGIYGLSPIQMAMRTIGTAKAGDRLAARFMGNGSMLSGIIKVKAPLKNQAQANGIRQRWMNSHGGAREGGGVAVLDAETDYEPITIPPDQLQFIESRRWEVNEVARLYGIPPHLVGDVEKSTSWGTGIEQQGIGFVTYTVTSYTGRIEQRSTRELVSTRGKHAEFDLDRLMRGSTQERYAALAQAAGGPWLTRDEARESENLNPLGNPEYNELLPPAGIGPMDEAPSAAKAARRARTEKRNAAGRVFTQLSEDYPAKAMAWMHEARWKGPSKVPLDFIKPDQKWLDATDPKHVQDFVRELERGRKLKPVILVKTPGHDKLDLVDGHHRYLACKERNQPVDAFIATADDHHGGWEKMHDFQIDNS